MFGSQPAMHCSLSGKARALPSVRLQSHLLSALAEPSPSSPQRLALRHSGDAAACGAGVISIPLTSMAPAHPQMAIHDG